MSNNDNKRTITEYTQRYQVVESTVYDPLEEVEDKLYTLYKVGCDPDDITRILSVDIAHPVSEKSTVEEILQEIEGYMMDIQMYGIITEETMIEQLIDATSTLDIVASPVDRNNKEHTDEGDDNVDEKYILDDSLWYEDDEEALLELDETRQVVTRSKYYNNRSNRESSEDEYVPESMVLDIVDFINRGR